MPRYTFIMIGVAAIVFSAVAGSEKGFQGTYRNVEMHMTFDFNSDGTVVWTDSFQCSQQCKGTYTDKGDRVILDMLVHPLIGADLGEVLNPSSKTSSPTPTIPSIVHVKIELIRQGDALMLQTDKPEHAIRLERR
jgi:hypothetical protein